MKAMTIGQLASASRVPPRTIRFYEAKRLLPSPRRAPSGYRLYGSDDLKRLRLIRRARSLGFSLTEVGELLRLAPRFFRYREPDWPDRIEASLSRVETLIALIPVS